MKRTAFLKWAIAVVAVIALTVSGLLIAGAKVPVPVGGKLEAVSVKTMGAVGNGANDDTAAFRQAIAKAKADGVPVFVPGGSYRLTGTLTLDGVDMIGDDSGAWPADNDSLPNLLMTNPNAPLFSLKNCSISGLKITVQSNDSNRNSFQPCLRVDGNNVTIRNMKLAQVTTGVKTGVNGITGLLIENVFMPTTHQIGVSVSGTTGAILKNIEMWTPTQNASDFPVSGTAFYLRDNRELYMQGCFTFNAASGMLFEGANDAVLDNCSVDLTGRGLILKDSGSIEVNGGTYWTHASGVAVEPGSSTALKVFGAELRSNGDAALRVNGGASTVVEGTIIRRTMDNRNVSAVALYDSPNVTVNGCIIYCELQSGQGPAATWSNARNLVFTGNILSTGGVGYTGNRPAGCRVENNIITPSSGGVQ